MNSILFIHPLNECNNSFLHRAHCLVPNKYNFFKNQFIRNQIKWAIWQGIFLYICHGPWQHIIINGLTWPSEANDASSSDFFLFHFITLLVPPSSPSLLPPPASSSLLPPRPSFFLIQHCLNHLESEIGHFSSILTKALPTDRRTNQPTDKASDRDTVASKNLHCI